MSAAALYTMADVAIQTNDSAVIAELRTVKRVSHKHDVGFKHCWSGCANKHCNRGRHKGDVHNCQNADMYVQKKTCRIC